MTTTRKGRKPTTIAGAVGAAFAQRARELGVGSDPVGDEILVLALERLQASLVEVLRLLKGRQP